MRWLVGFWVAHSITCRTMPIIGVKVAVVVFFFFLSRAMSAFYRQVQSTRRVMMGGADDKQSRKNAIIFRNKTKPKRKRILIVQLNTIETKH